jgi:hypothetical protein
MGRGAVRIEFVKGEARRYESVLHRPDGVVVVLDGGGYNEVGDGAELPHDLAHLIVEDELALSDGVWGVLVRGGLFRHAKVVSGRQAPHAAKRGREVIAQAGDRIMQAEMLTRAVCDACAGRLGADPAAVSRAVGPRWSSDTLTRDALSRACARLRDAAERWARLAPGGRLEEMSNSPSPVRRSDKGDSAREPRDRRRIEKWAS